MAGSFASRAYRQISENGLQQPIIFTALFGAYCYRVYALSARMDKQISSPAGLTQEPVKCRFKLGNETSATFTLPDGRMIGYAQYGSRTDKPIIYLHGLPGCRMEGAWLESYAEKHGACLIAVDRPGIGWSSPNPGWKLLDHVKDIECLTEHLELERYGVLGISGGGPYALACAIGLPADKLKVVSLVCALGPPEIGYKGMKFMNRLGWDFGWRYFPSLCRLWFKRSAHAQLHLTDEERLELWKKEFANSDHHEKDVPAFTDDDFMRLSLRGGREVFAQGFDHLIEDAVLMSSPFEFRVEDIRSDLPVRLWYGTLDTNVPLNHGRQIAARVGANARLFVEDETHVSLEVNHTDRFIEDLAKHI